MCDYDNPWIYNERPFTSDDVHDYFGFVYLITNFSNKRQYMGRKYFWSFRKPQGKKRKVKQESDWKKYYGSCPELKEDIKKYNIREQNVLVKIKYVKIVLRLFV